MSIDFREDGSGMSIGGINVEDMQQAYYEKQQEALQPVIRPDGTIISMIEEMYVQARTWHHRYLLAEQTIVQLQEQNEKLKASLSAKENVSQEQTNNGKEKKTASNDREKVSKEPR